MQLCCFIKRFNIYMTLTTVDNVGGEGGAGLEEVSPVSEVEEVSVEVAPVDVEDTSEERMSVV